jgi:phosphatidylserine/phosphatidylglycerophosphate/cardiolipin synthase-like enzyme
MDKENGKKTQITRFLVEKGMDTRWMGGRGKGAMHHKYAVFDGKLVETGSHNWTNNAEQNDFENVLLTTNSPAVKAYSRKFSELYGMAVPPVPEQLPAPEKVEGSSLAAE